MKIKKIGSYALIIAALLGFAAYKGFFKTTTEKTSDNYESKKQGSEIVQKITETDSDFVNDLTVDVIETDDDTFDNSSIADQTVENSGSLKTVKLSELPEKFRYTLDYIRTHDGYGPKDFYKRTPSEKNQFNNREGFDIDKNQIYQEYGVDPYVGPGQGTGNGDRLLVGNGGSVYVTRDHWKSLLKVIEE